MEDITISVGALGELIMQDMECAESDMRLLGKLHPTLAAFYRGRIGGYMVVGASHQHIRDLGDYCTNKLHMMEKGGIE